MDNKKKTINLRELYEEKRAYPRIKVDSLVTIRKDDDTKLSGMLHDISPDGVQIIVDTKTARELNPSGRQLTKKTQPEVQLKFYLRIDDANREVNALIKLFYFSIVDTDVIAFGGQFIKFLDMSERHVTKYIEQSIVPVENKVVKLLNQPMTSQDLRDQIDDENISLEDTLNLLKKKKEIVSYKEEKQEKFVNLESAIESILQRLDNFEKRIASIETIIKKATKTKNQT